MNSFKFGRGNFWGIIIPGGFLYANVIIVYSSSFTQNIFSVNGFGYSFIILSILVSYILGYIIRLIKPIYVEILSLPIEIFILFLKRRFNSLLRIFRINKKHFLYTSKYQYILESFPYLNWFYEKHLSFLPKEVSEFYYELKMNAFDDDIEKMKRLDFINYAKRYIYEYSSSLKEEIYFSEGLSRFLNGMFYSIILSIYLISNNIDKLQLASYPIEIIYPTYIFILAIVLIRYKNVRRFESLIIFESFYIVNKKYSDD